MLEGGAGFISRQQMSSAVAEDFSGDGELITFANL